MSTTATPEQAVLTPEPLLQMHFSFAASRVLSTAVQLDLFTHISQGKHTLEEIAAASDASIRGMRGILDALSVFGLLAKKEGRYELTPLSSTYLVSSSPQYFGDMFGVDAMWEAWGKLPETVRTGKPARRVELETEGMEFFQVLVRSLHVWNRHSGRLLAQVVGAGLPADARYLDVACGSGIWGISLAEAFPQSHVTAQDFADMLETTREFVKKHNLADRFDYLPGNLREVEFGEAKYDAAVLGNIVHSEGEKASRELFAKMHRALKPGGKLAIVDMIPNNERTGPPFPLIFELNMLVNTEEGGVYTVAEYTEWLKAAGFSNVETADIASHSPLIVATK